MTTGEEARPTVTICVPVAHRVDIQSSRDITVGAQLADSQVLIFKNGWPSWESLTDELARVLTVEHAVKEVSSKTVPLGKAPNFDEIQGIVMSADLVIIGLANCGSCTVPSMQNAARIAEHRPVIVAATERFMGLAESLGNNIKVVELPHNLEQMSPEELTAAGPDIFAKLVKGFYQENGQ